jgi:gamma-glutamylcyclotransferase (GGCT)/AIG2-like uncharacterized protein YtfP
MPTKTSKHTNNNTTTQPQTINVFFYGSLLSPTILSTVLSTPLTTTPPTKPGKTSGFQLKLWGPYPVLIRAPATHKGKVNGEVCAVTLEQFDRLQNYEGPMYRWRECDVELEGREGGEVLRGCRVFCARREGSRELVDGVWSLEFLKVPEG